MNKYIFGTAALALSIIACGISAPSAPTQDLDTIVASTLTAMTAQTPPTQTASGITITESGIQFTIPEGVATGATREIIQRSEDADDMPYWAVYPEFKKFNFSRSDPFVSNFNMTLSIIPAQEYAQMNEIAAKAIPELQANISSGNFKGVTILPPYNAALIIDEKNALLNFQNGSGVRSVQQYHQGPVPITNDYLLYSFQGITSDGNWYISFVAPIKSPILVDENYNPNPGSTTPTPMVPQGGVPFDANSFSVESIEQYNQAIRDLLNQETEDQFTPSLHLLDTLVQSIIVNTP